MGRGGLVVAVFPRDFGKPRPALIVQANAYDQLGSVTLLPLTSDLSGDATFRINVLPSDSNGLKQRCQVMVDKAQTVYADKIGRRIGQLDRRTLDRVDTALALFLGLA